LIFVSVMILAAEWLRAAGRGVDSNGRPTATSPAGESLRI
jgi:hypothetical protein